MQCSARSKRSGEQCRKAAVAGGKVCRLHGGRSLKGLASPLYRHGRYSKSLPAKLAQRYEAARTSAALLSVRDDLAVCESRLMDLFTRVDSGESRYLWKALGVALDAFNKALATNDVGAMQGHLATMRQLISRGSNDFFAWQEIQSLWETRCRLTMTETKTLVMMQQMITVEQLMIYTGAITDTIRRAVTAHADPASARTILAELTTEFERYAVREAGAEA